MDIDFIDLLYQAGFTSKIKYLFTKNNSRYFFIYPSHYYTSDCTQQIYDKQTSNSLEMFEYLKVELKYAIRQQKINKLLNENN